MPASPLAAAGRHAVLMQRTENRLRAEIDAVLNRAQGRLVRLVQLRDPMAVSAGRRAARIASLQKEADTILTKAYSEIHALTKETLVEVAKASARFGQKAIDAATSGIQQISGTAALPTTNLIRAAATQSPVQGDVMFKWWSQQKATAKAAFRRTVTQAVVRGDSSATLARALRGTVNAAGRRTGGVFAASRREAVALARTALTEVTSRAAILTYQENSDLMRKVEFLVTLDEVTCEVCGGLDGNVYDLSDPNLPVPPLHYNCRCTLLPVLDYKALGVQAPKEEKREKFPEWFAKQDAETQDAMLGPGKADLVRSGEASFSDLVNRDGRVLTLDELRE